MSRARSRLFAVLAAVGMLTLGGASTTVAADPADGVAASLLVADDLPDGLESSGIAGATDFDINFPSYDANGGLEKANQVWAAADLTGTETVAYVFDFRMLFPDAAAAQAYLDEAEERLSESLTGITLQSATPPLADVVRRYAGTISGNGITADVQNFLLREGPVVSKVYILGFGTTLDDALPIAQAAADRTEAWLASIPANSPVGSPAVSPSVSPSASAVGSAPPPGSEIRQWASGATASSEYGSGTYAATQATGAPDVTGYSDDPLAWAPGPPDGTTEWLELTYPHAVVPSDISIIESYGNGAIVLVQALDPGTDTWVKLWAGSDTSARDDIVAFRPTLAPVAFATDQVRITMGDIVPGWSEIDAVELVGTIP